MVFSWKGYGLIVPLLLTIGTYSLVKISSSITDMAIKTSISLSLAIIGMLLWCLGRQFIRNESIIDVTEMKRKQKYDTFCSIHVKHWGATTILLSFIMAVIDLIV